MGATAKKRQLEPVVEAPAPRVVYTSPPVQLATLVAEEDGGWRVKIGTTERVIGADASVDPALLRDALESGSRVIVDNAADPVIAGVLLTLRPVSIDRNGDVDADVRSFKVSASEHASMRTPSAFLQINTREVEIFGDKVFARARNLAKIAAALIRLN